MGYEGALLSLLRRLFSNSIVSWLAGSNLAHSPQSEAIGTRSSSTHRSEAFLAFLLWLYLFALIVTIVMSRSIGSAMFLNRFDGRALALFYILTGLSVASIVTAIERTSHKLSLNRQSLLTLMLLFGIMATCSLVYTRLSLGDHPYVCGAFYLSVESLAFVTTVQFWSIASSALSLKQARRWYVLIATGGVLGSVVGGSATHWLAHWPIWQLTSLISCATFIPILCIFAVKLIASRYPQAFHKQVDRWNLDRKSSRAVLSRRELRRTTPSHRLSNTTSQNPLMRKFAAVSLLMVLSTTLVDFHFKTLAGQSYAGNLQDLTGFFGGFYLAVGIMTLVCQLAVTPLILRWKSAFFGLAASPVALLILGIANAIVPGLGIASFFKLTDSVLAHSTYRSCQEMLYTPLPTRWVRQIKNSADGVWGRYGLLTAGLILIAFTTWQQKLGERSLPLLSSVSIVVWLGSVYLLKREYRSQATNALQSQKEETAEVPPLLRERSAA